jgi:signal peptidase I
VTSLAEHPVRMNRAGSGNWPSMRLKIKRTWEIASILLVIAACVFWALFLRPQSLGGSAAYILVSGQSMEPLYHTGDLILVERSKTYAIGDIIAYRVPKGDPMAGAQVIHRIIRGNATHGFVVQGDNRTAPDVWRPRQTDIVGSAQVRIPHAAVGLQFLRSPLLLGILAASFVFVYALTGRNKKQESEPADSASIEAPSARDGATPAVARQSDTASTPDVRPPKQVEMVDSPEPTTALPPVSPQFLRSPMALGLLAASFVVVYLLTGREQKRG